MNAHHTAVRLWDSRTARISGCDSGQSPPPAHRSRRSPTPAGTPVGAGPDAAVGRRQPQPAPRVSEEDLALLRLVAEGLPMDSVAARLGMSPRTARRRIHDLCERIGVTGTMQAVVWAAHRGLV